MEQTWHEHVFDMYKDGPTLTAAAAASMIDPSSKVTVNGGFFRKLGKQFLLEASGRISSAVTSPGTARFDLRYGGTVIADSLQIPLNIVVQTNVAWILRMWLTLRAVGSAANFIMQGEWLSGANINTAAPATGPGPGGCLIPFNTPPVVGNNFDATASQAIDVFFTQTLGTGSLTCHQARMVALN